MQYKFIGVLIFWITLSNFSFSQPVEKHLQKIHQLTFGGDNAEAYFSFDSKRLTCQITNPKWDVKCDQIYCIDIKKASADSTYRPKLLSTGKGRTTCSYFLKDGKHVLYASTHEAGKDCPDAGDLRKGGKYLWPLFQSFDIYVTDIKSGKITRKLADTMGYDAEATLSPDGKKIVFTSDRSGDLELYTMDVDGGNVRQITSGLGYDGGAFFSPDSKQIVFRASRPTKEEDILEYKTLLAQHLVAPTNMEIYTCNVDGSNLTQVTHLGKANWAPFFHPDGKRILFSSNHASKKGWDFQLYMINADGTGLEQITSESYFNAFPMFSPDGKKIVWSSNRNNHGGHDTNIFIADWKE
jgi:Tol biopolymer transport system component